MNRDYATPANDITMNQSRLEIKITRDANDRNVDINAMSLQAAQSFLILFQSVAKVIELTAENRDVKIQITSGSAVIAAEGETVGEVKREFDAILDNRSNNQELIQQWRRIQSLFVANGLQYEANFFTNGQRMPFYDELKNRGRLKAAPSAMSSREKPIEFITGKLIEIGGKKPNIHVEVNGNLLPPVSCSEVSASKAKAYLYQTIRFSAWTRLMNDGARRLALCDSYANEDIYDELSSIVVELFESDPIEALKKIHHQCRFYIDNQQFGKLRKFLRLFINDRTDINMLKTILIITQSIKEHERIKEMVEDIKVIFDRQYKILDKKNRR